MKSVIPRTIGPVLVVVAAATACSSATGGQAGAEQAALARAAANRRPANPADVRFMQGMVPHHAQAVLMARMAPSHDASQALRILCERIIVAQGDEITWMRNWLADQGQEVPAADAMHMRMRMGGVEHDMLMPGMLTPEQLAQLDAARGSEFDRLFLTFMIQHHEGALTMIDELFGSYGGAQDDDVFKIASDMYADQTTEIDFMQKMLDAQSGGRP
jgi:uncharacterized protein (DUF305 family)